MAAPKPAMKQCPFCAEEIRAEAVVCRYCNRDLPPLPQWAIDVAAQTTQRQPQPKKNSGCGGLFLVLVLLVGFGMLAVALTNNTPAAETSKPSVFPSPTSTPRPSPTPRATPTATPTPDPAVVRQQLIESGFSFWDGSHIALTRAIKEAMHNPKTYEHVDTTYIDRGDYLVVTTEYRGANVFGGIVKNSVTAHANLDGSLIAIVEQSP